MSAAASQTTLAANLHTLIEGMPGFILVLAPEGDHTIEAASRAWREQAGVVREALVGCPFLPAVSAHAFAGDADELRTALARAAADRQRVGLPVRSHPGEASGAASAPRCWKPEIVPVLSPSGALVHLVHRVDDVTELARARDAAVAALEQANRELESLSYSVSHDLRAPLRAIDGFARILEEDHGARLDAEGMRVIAVIRESSTRLSRLIEDILGLSRLGRRPMSVEALDMSRMAGEAFAEICAQASRRPELALPPLPHARGDAALMKHVWSHLLGNAVKFTARVERPVIEVSGRESGGECVYSVRDNGAGFDMRYHDRLFGLFQRLHPEAEFAGSGVGLTIVQRVLVRHGGRVWGEGAPGAGATFHFALPRGESHA